MINLGCLDQAGDMGGEGAIPVLLMVSTCGGSTEMPRGCEITVLLWDDHVVFCYGTISYAPKCDPDEDI